MSLELKGFNPLLVDQVYISTNPYFNQDSRDERYILISLGKSDHRERSIESRITESLRILGLEHSGVPYIGRNKRKLSRAERELLGSRDFEEVFPLVKEILSPDNFTSAYDRAYSDFPSHNSEIGINYSLVTHGNMQMILSHDHSKITKSFIDDQMQRTALTELGLGLQAKIYLAIGKQGENIGKIKELIDAEARITRSDVLNIFDHEGISEVSTANMMDMVYSIVFPSNILANTNYLAYEDTRTTAYREGKILRNSAKIARNKLIIDRGIKEYEDL